MTSEEWRDAMRAHGFSFQCLAQAREVGSRSKIPNIDIWQVWDADGRLITSVITREIDFRKDEPPALFVFFIQETGTVSEDVAHLQGLSEKLQERERELRAS